MRRSLWLLIALSSAAAPAAELTRVASSFDEGHPFGLLLDASFLWRREAATIAREWYGLPNRTVAELAYNSTRTELDLSAKIGLYRDLELRVGIPVVFQDDRTWRFASGRDATNTTIYQNYVNAQGTPGDTPGNSPDLGTGRLFDVGNPSTSFRGGLGDLFLGLAWAPLVQRRDPSNPTWVLRFDYTAPTAARLDPTVQTTASQRGPIGERLHRLTFSTALSRRTGLFEPYFELHYTLPLRATDSYSSCDATSTERMSHPENCGNQWWSRADAGLRPLHTGGVRFGTELTVFERAPQHQRVALDLRGWLTYFSEGRVYNELSDVLKKLLYQQDYGQVGARLSLVGQPAEFFIVRASASLSYNTDHRLTAEALIAPLAPGSGAADITQPEGQALINPNFDFRIDRTGWRFLTQDQVQFQVQVTASFVL